MANTSLGITKSSTQTMEALAQLHLVQIADTAYAALSGRTKSRAALKKILNDALDAMNELSAASVTSDRNFTGA